MWEFAYHFKIKRIWRGMETILKTLIHEIIIKAIYIFLIYQKLFNLKFITLFSM